MLPPSSSTAVHWGIKGEISLHHTGPCGKGDTRLSLQLWGSFRAGVVQKITLISQAADSRSSKQSPSSHDGVSHLPEQPFLPPPGLHTIKSSAPQKNLWSYCRSSNSLIQEGWEPWPSRVSTEGQPVQCSPDRSSSSKAWPDLKPRAQRLILNNFLAYSKICLSLTCQSHRCEKGKDQNWSHQGPTLHPLARPFVFTSAEFLTAALQHALLQLTHWHTAAMSPQLAKARTINWGKQLKF